MLGTHERKLVAWTTRCLLQVVLGFMCLYFVIILAILLYGGSAYLPLSTVPVWGQQWPAYVFPLAGILLVISSGFFVACLR